MLPTPYDWIDERRQVAVLWAVFGVMVVTALALGELKPPGGWLALEFPAFSSSASGVGTWSAAQRETALFGLGVDFLFLFVYPFFLSLFLERAGRGWKLPDWLARLCVKLGALVLLAAPLDALENIGLYLMIKGQSGTALQWFISAVSAPKWIVALIAAALAWVCLGFWLVRKAKA